MIEMENFVWRDDPDLALKKKKVSSQLIAKELYFTKSYST
jgi:hypothetical protein